MFDFVNIGRKLPLYFAVAALVAFGGIQCVSAQQQTGLESPEKEDLQTQYVDLIEKWRASIKRVTEAGIRFNLSSQEESTDHRKKWFQEVAKTEQILDQLKPVALRLFDLTPEPDRDLTDFVGILSQDFFDRGRYRDAYRIAERILKKQPNNQALIYVRGRSSIFLNKFEEAAEFASKHSAMLDSLPPEEKRYFDQLDTFRENYKQELAFQEKEAQADDLPRVEIKTTKGTFVVELFENEAPNTVGNFIHLVEQKHYDGLIFHRTINHFMAQTGGVNAKGERAAVDYMIYDECGEPNARMHYRGVLSMALGRGPNTGSCQFFITFVPTFFLDAKHTVFGRVVDGWDAVDSINRTFTSDENGEKPILTAIPDRIISATVIRKRNHEYKPDKFVVDE